MQYSDYFSNQAVQVCRKYNIVEERPVNEVENKIYQELSTGQGFDKDDREYLKGIHGQDQRKELAKPSNDSGTTPGSFFDI